jgi:ribonuclease H / adenosylcobalamin/alpha-ribazole phosphatase
LLAGVLTRHPGRRVVAVSHVTPIKTALRLALGAPHEAIFRFHLDTASLSVVDYYTDGECNVRVLNRAEQLH